MLVCVALLGAVSDLQAADVCVSSNNEATVSTCIRVNEINGWLVNEQRRLLLAGKASEPITLRFKSGEYILDSPIRIVRREPGYVGRIQLSGQGDTTVLRGVMRLPTEAITQGTVEGVRLPHGTRIAHLNRLLLDRIPQTSAMMFGKPGVPDLDVLANGRRLPRSAAPMSNTLRIERATDTGSPMVAARAAATLYEQETELILSGYFQHDWADETISVSGIDLTAGGFVLSQAPTYGVRQQARVEILNAIRDLRPGSWASRVKSGVIYVVPSSAYDATTIEIPYSPSAVIVEGVNNVEISNIAFNGFRADAIRLINVSDATLTNLEIANAANSAVVVQGAQVVMTGLRIHDIGATGISVTGGNRKTLDSGKNIVTASDIQRVGLTRHTYSPAVLLNGVGNEISSTFMADGPHSAIVFHGNDHLIRRNTIQRFVLDTDDAGAIYTGRDWTARGTVVEENVIRDVGSNLVNTFKAKGVYLDDQASGIIVRRNVFDNVPQAVFIGGGRDNEIEGNLMSNCAAAVTADSRGVAYQSNPAATARHDALVSQTRALNTQAPPYSTRYPKLKTILSTSPERPLGNGVSHNVASARCTLFALRGLSVSDISKGGNRKTTGEIDLTGVTVNNVTPTISSSYNKGYDSNEAAEW